MNKTKYKCKICGNEYEYCPSCKNIKSFHSWRRYADTQNCYKIFMILRDSALKNISANEAKLQLQKCDLSQCTNYYPMIKNQINEILQE